MSEWMLRDLAAAHGLRYVALRYFNVAGATRAAHRRHAHRATHLIKVACQAAAGVRTTLSIFGTDYPTPDGTGVRDYIHVDDLAARASRAPSTTCAQAAIRRPSISGMATATRARSAADGRAREWPPPLTVAERPRRPGDPPSLVAHADRIREVLGWRPRFDDLEVTSCGRSSSGSSGCCGSRSLQLN